MIRMEKLPNITLRAIEPEDLDMLYHIENDRELWNAGSTNVPYSRYALHEYLANVTGDIYTDKQLRLIIEDETGTPVGLIDLANFNPQHCRAEVGLVIRKPYRGKRYGQAALNQLLDYAHDILHIHQLYALIREDNIQCINSFIHAGFQKDAILSDWLFDGERYYPVELLRYFL